MAVDKTSVSIYLLKPGVLAEVEQAFENRSPLVNLDGWFHPIEPTRREPSWLQALQPYLGQLNTESLRSEMPAALVLVRRGHQNFLLSFGHSWTLLKTAWLEPDFGRRVALNAIPPSQILELNSEQVFARWHVASERSPRATDFEAFGVALDRDLVAALEGVPSDPLFGGVARGSTSLRVKIHLTTIAHVLDKAAQLFASDAYKKRWPEIDNLSPVIEPAELIELDSLLDAQIQSGAADSNAVLFAPSFRRGDASFASSFIFGRNSKNAWLAPYLQYSFWKQHLADIGLKPSLGVARETKIHMLDTNGDRFETRSVYDCLGYEITKNGEQYVLSSGIWYRAETKFLKGVQRALAALKPSALALPAWDQKSHEDEYNALCSKTGGLVLLDKKIVHYGGAQSKFEFCDFMHIKKRTLFFAKIPSRSSDCSHLVEQVKSTADLLFSPDGGFRSKLKKSLQKIGMTDVAWLDTRPRSGDWNLCVVLMGKTHDKLPLFARCSLSRLVKYCDERGHPLRLQCV
jgi:uncharacterized protein (TIGR04141 family)